MSNGWLKATMTGAAILLLGGCANPFTTSDNEYGLVADEQALHTVDALDLQAPLLRVGGKGTANLNTSILDYLVNAKLVGTIEGQQGKKADQLSGLTIPVKVEGPFADPKIDVQLDEMLKAKADAVKAKLKADIASKKAELKKQIELAKKKLAESKKREFEQKLEIEKAKKDAEYKQKIDDAANDLLKKLFN